MKHYEEIVEPFTTVPQGATVLTEQKLALTRDFKPTGWFGKNVWVRAVLDVVVLHRSKALVVDWKTGKRLDEDDQLALCAGVLMAQQKDVDSVRTAFVWLQEEPGSGNLTTVREYTRDDLPKIWERFLNREERWQRAFANNEFPARPSGLCRKWCPVTQCSYHGG